MDEATTTVNFNFCAPNLSGQLELSKNKTGRAPLACAKRYPGGIQVGQQAISAGKLEIRVSILTDPTWPT